MHLIIIIWVLTAENVAKKFNISRKEQDEFALNSQKKTESN